MGKDILVILMVAFGLFAIIMFVLFYAYLKKYYNNKHISEDYKKDIDDTPIEEEEIEIPKEEEIKEERSFSKEMNSMKIIEEENDFVPVKKK